MKQIVLTASLCALALPAMAQLKDWQVGAVLDVAASSRNLALGGREQGLALGHSDASIFGPLGQHAQAQLTLAAHSHEGKTALELEEAWVQSRSLPAGLQLRAGRFASQFGYLNEQHPHADDFVERPLLYRAFLGGHWFDDGLRVNWTAPTDQYLRLGAEIFSGTQLIEEAASARKPGALVLTARTGGDINTAQSWQAGVSWLHNRREAAVESEDGHDHSAGSDHDHAHAHGAAYSGKNLKSFDLTWKWAPNGNNSREQVRITYELAHISGLNRYASTSDRHIASYLSAVWRFAPNWEMGARTDALKVRMPHGDHFHNGRLQETSLMLAYKPTHMQSLRLQATKQRSKDGFDTAKYAVQLQYVLSFGAHAAHSY